MAQEQQQGNGLIGGGIGLVAGGLAGYRTSSPVSDLVAERLTDKDFTKGYAVRDELFKRNPNAREDIFSPERKEFSDLINNAVVKRRNIRDSVAILTLLGLPITTALIGSTLTD